MRAMAITGTATDFAALDAPFLPGYTMVFANPTSGSLVVQEADESGGSYSTVATVPADGFIEGTVSKQFVKVSTSATVYVLGN